MSKQSDAKAKQGYNPKPLARCCRTCGNLVRKMHPIYKSYEMSRPCGIGGFAVKAQGVCDLWEIKIEPRADSDDDGEPD